MAITHVEAELRGTRGRKQIVRFMVDGGATCSLLPLRTWKALGLRPKRSLTFTLADGTAIERNVSECHFTIAGVDGHSPVILGQEGDAALLGAVTLESLGLVLKPFTRTLHPMRMVLT
jgi:predicted aspartyl protease